MHAPTDDIVPRDNAGRIYSALRHPKSCSPSWRPDQAAAFVTQITDAKLRDQPLGTTMRNWVRFDPQEALGWLDRQLRAGDLDSAFSGAAHNFRETDSVEALYWSEQIQNADKRGGQVHSFAREWLKTNPEQASTYIMTSPEFSEKDRERFRAPPKPQLHPAIENECSRTVRLTQVSGNLHQRMIDGGTGTFANVTLEILHCLGCWLANRGERCCRGRDQDWILGFQLGGHRGYGISASKILELHDEKGFHRIRTVITQGTGVYGLQLLPIGLPFGGAGVRRQPAQGVPRLPVGSVIHIV
ncbi:MAG: hypothetical protein ACI9QL_003073 [Candidatus Omnitrophota bacterium]|jgi:hypothetical protein